MVKGFKKHMDTGKLVKVVGKVNQDNSIDYIDDYSVDAEKISLETVNKMISYMGNEMINGFFY